MSMPALDETRRALEHFDNNRELYERRRRVQLLAGMGMTNEEVACETGIPRKHVSYHKSKPPPPQRPRLYDANAVSDERAQQLEQRADDTLRLAAVLRDEDPTLVWGTLIRLDRRQLQELTMIALAAIPIDATRRELLGWVADLTTSTKDSEAIQ